MLKFISKALLPLVMDKQARTKLESRRAYSNGSPAGAAPPEPETPPAEKREMTPEREELIRQARAVRRSKAKFLDDLSEEERQKFYDIALRELRRAQEKKGGGKGR